MRSQQANAIAHPLPLSWIMAYLRPLLSPVHQRLLDRVQGNELIEIYPYVEICTNKNTCRSVKLEVDHCEFLRD